MLYKYISVSFWKKLWYSNLLAFHNVNVVQYIASFDNEHLQMYF